MDEWTLVTGGAKGLGAAIAKKLSQEGYKVLVHYNKSKDEAIEIKKLCPGSEIIQGDFNQMDAFTAKLKDYKIKNIIYNVGNYALGGPLDTSLEQWNDLLQVNLTAPFVLFSKLPLLKEGSIVTIGMAGLNYPRSDDRTTAYTITKMSLLMLTKALAKQGLHANMVSPGYLERSIDLPKNAVTVSLDDAAEAVLFCLKNRSIMGQNIEVAAGVRL